jgi:hypothetical protein
LAEKEPVEFSLIAYNSAFHSSAAVFSGTFANRPMPSIAVVFTLCSVNYLAHAKTLGESLLEHNPECRFVIGLVDRIPVGVALSLPSGCELIPVEDLKIAAFADMVTRYNIVELNTAVKPFYIEHIYQQDPEVEHVIYLDPDILIFYSLNTLIANLRAHPLIFTPHSCTFDNTRTIIDYEQAMLSTGIYNLGFLGTHRSAEVFAFLRWWQTRLVDHCYYRPGAGLFVDQLWTILAPLYFPSSYVEKDPGYNMAYWNLFERTLQKGPAGYLVNDRHPLIFFHFSNHSIDTPTELANRRWPAVPTFEERPELRPLFAGYRERLLRNGFLIMRSLNCYYEQARTLHAARHRTGRMRAFARRTSTKGLRLLPAGIRGLLGQVGRFVSVSCSGEERQSS